ncbi:hypothetical protein BGZ96_001264 [Linnemannia gamsii]|uniref:Uncharacterized protein n=1 Tax=Linnemannia gamsii TaxID=64522 RepID=A0ABQ7JMW5_9FUNG|nr:hypothetical protein BGZ96_001264 [Linnemannia gamsii]
MSVLLGRLRIGIAALLLLIIILNSVFWALYINSLSTKVNTRTFSTLARLVIADHVLLFLTFVYAAVPRFPTKVPRYARAFVLFVLAVYMLYYHLYSLSNLFRSRLFLCKGSSMETTCGIHRVVQIFGSVAGFLIMFEIALTLKETDPNPYTGVAETQGPVAGGVGVGGQPDPYQQAMQTPQPMQQIHPQQQQFQQQGMYYPQQQQPFVMAQQQPLQNATHKFEAPGQPQQQFQPQSLYQLSPQLQQQQQFYQPLQPGQQPLQQHNPYLQQQQSVATQPMVPGSLVTTTPQPGGQAIAPYTSSGGASVAVSPVLPVGGYSIPSPSVGNQSPVHLPQ